MKTYSVKQIIDVIQTGFACGNKAAVESLREVLTLIETDGETTG